MIKEVAMDAVGVTSLQWKVKDAHTILSWLTSLDKPIMDEINKHPEMEHILEAARKFINPPVEQITSLTLEVK